MIANKVNEVRLSNYLSILSSSLSGSSLPAARRQIRRAAKRAAFVRPNLDEEAYAKWHRCNDRCLLPHSLSPEVVSYAQLFIEKVLWNYATSVSELNIQVALDYNHMEGLWSFGPGASQGVTGTHTAEKIDQYMACTARCEPYVTRLRRYNPYLSAIDAVQGIGDRTVVGSKMTTVPKNETSVRTIEIQPSGNMVMQLAAGRYVEGVLRLIGLDIKHQQPLNKALARRGSIDGSVATIDLTSASDLVSFNLIKELWPLEWGVLLGNLRTEKVLINGTWHSQNMLSGMGNGFTFPVMTLTLLSLVMANRFSHISTRLTRVDWSRTAVFGDDIIVPTEEYESLTAVLSQAGLIVNTAKSFAHGLFRESCGGDYLNGVDITPVYVRTLRFDHEIYNEINKLALWSARNNLFPLLALRYLFSLLRKGPYFVPFWYPPDSGVRTTVVSQRIRHLRPIVRSKPYMGQCLMMLACGGYVEDVGFGPFYTPRPREVRMYTKVSRLPKGYLDGADATSVVSVSLQAKIDLLIDLAR